MSHISFDTLIDYVDGKLTSDESVSVEIHLATNCESCQADLAWVDQTLTLMKTDDWLAPPANLSKSVREAFKKEYQPVEASPSLLERIQAWLAPRPQVAWAAVAALVLVAVLFALQLGSDRSVEQVATASITDGIAVVLPADGDSWEPVEKDASYSSGDTIRTGEDSTVVLTHADESVTVIESNTILQIIEMSFSSDGTQITILAQSSGLTRHRVNPLPGEGSIYEVRTPAATVNVIGTYFSVLVESNGDTDVSVEEGKVAVKGGNETVEVAAGQFTSVAMGGQPSTVTSIPSPTMTATAEGDQTSSLMTPVVDPDATDASPLDATPTPTSTNTPRDPTATATDEATSTGTATRTPTSTASSTATSEPSTVTNTPIPPAATPTPPPVNTDPPPPTVTQPPRPTSTPPPPTATQPPPTNTPQPPPTNTPPPPPTDEPTPYPAPDTSDPPTATPPPPPTVETTPYPPPVDEGTAQSTSEPTSDEDPGPSGPPGQTKTPPGQDNNGGNSPPGQTRTPPGQER